MLKKLVLCSDVSSVPLRVAAQEAGMAPADGRVKRPRATQQMNAIGHAQGFARTLKKPSAYSDVSLLALGVDASLWTVAPGGQTKFLRAEAIGNDKERVEGLLTGLKKPVRMSDCPSKVIVVGADVGNRWTLTALWRKPAAPRYGAKGS